MTGGHGRPPLLQAAAHSYSCSNHVVSKRFLKPRIKAYPLDRLPDSLDAGQADNALVNHLHGQVFLELLPHLEVLSFRAGLPQAVEEFIDLPAK
jgi:hypothetical protein